MKAKCRQNPANALWYCTRMGVTGEGATPMEAFADMMALYGEFIREQHKRSFRIQTSPRA